MTDNHLHPVDGLVPNLHEAPGFAPDFDPVAVPHFPVIVLEVTPATGADAYVSPYRVTMDGEPVAVPRPSDHAHRQHRAGERDRLVEGGFEPAQPDARTSDEDADVTVHEHALAVALDAASRKIASRGWVAGRVNAIDADGNRWPMIIGANGERLDLNSLSAPHRKQRRWIPLAAASLAVALSGATIGTLLASRAPVEAETPTATTVIASRRPTAQPTEYPQLPPVGASTHARWAFGPLADPSALVQSPDGEVVVRTADHLTLLDPATGTPAWTAEVPDNTTGPWITSIDGQQAVVTGTTVNTTVTWRPLIDLNQAHVVPVDAGAVITPLPGGLLFDGPDQRVGLLAGDALATRLLPAGSVPVGVDGTTVLAANGRQLWRLDRDQPQTPEPLALQSPGAGARPGTSAVWRGGRLLTFWTLVGTTNAGIARTVAALHDGRGNLVKVITVQAQAAALDQVKTPDKRYTLLSDGSVVDHVRANLIPAAGSWQGTTLVGSALFGRSGELPARYDLVTRKLATSQGATAADPVGQLGTDLLALADRSDGLALYRLQEAG